MAETTKELRQPHVGLIVDIVGRNVKARGYGNNTTKRLSLSLNGGRIRCMVLGRSYRYEGTVQGGGYENEEGRWLLVSKSIPVWMVQPLDGQNYRKPMAVDESQIMYLEESEL